MICIFLFIFIICKYLTPLLIFSIAGYLQDELGVRNIRGNCKYEDFKKYLTRIEELEAAISYAALESQCEIESLKLDMIAMEERCFQAESLSQQMAVDKAKMQEVLEECKMQLHEAHDTISFLEMENNELKLVLKGSERRFKDLHYEVEEHLSNWLKDISGTGASMHVESNKNFSPVLNGNHSSLNGYCTCEEVLCPLVSKLILLETWDENVKNELQEMANQVQESELLVKKLKEELREEKLKAKEEAEDLTQAMAELRYEITGMLEEECKHRASIEQASLRRIQDLEEQVDIILIFLFCLLVFNCYKFEGYIQKMVEYQLYH
ncbi:hypothetical protein KSP39_PZI000541 [Platanthera zijinensis]|uniref:Uncharacterized protein n=1 Tax=Platanthera zijinensis TaxID=2320716 RepID=A0AAP0C2I8_9ASPA